MLPVFFLVFINCLHEQLECPSAVLYDLYDLYDLCVLFTVTLFGVLGGSERKEVYILSSSNSCVREQLECPAAVFV